VTEVATVFDVGLRRHQDVVGFGGVYFDPPDICPAADGFQFSLKNSFGHRRASVTDP
jgi:hypothetical protein